MATMKDEKKDKDTAPSPIEVALGHARNDLERKNAEMSLAVERQRKLVMQQQELLSDMVEEMKRELYKIQGRIEALEELLETEEAVPGGR